MSTLLFDYYTGEEGKTVEEGWKNKLIWGDNKLVMSSLLEKFAGKIDLIYIDPPFATGADFKFKILVGDEGKQITKEHSILEEKAYRDTWGKGLDSYLEMMYDRLVLMRELLGEDGFIYVHLDWHVGHYIKVMMDEIFGYENFRNEIVWFYKGGALTGVKKNFPRKHDIILLYSKSGDYTFNQIKYDEISEQMIKRWGQYFDEENKIRFGQIKKEKETYKRLVKKFIKKNGRNPGDEDIAWEIEGSLVRDVWEDIPEIRQSERYVESIGYVTQKPEALLKRIILASSNPGDLVADFFCGSGTTLAVAEKLGRRWIGCDLSRYAIHLTRKRLLGIEKSKDLINGNNNSRTYDIIANPFEILNLGKYERQYWQIKTFNNHSAKQTLFEYLAFMLKLYGAEPISGFRYIHGKKGNALVYVGAVDSPITIREVLDAMNECKILSQKELHILGWEWEMGLHEAIQDIAKKEKMKLKLRLVPNDVLDKRAVEKGDIKFFELAYFKVNIQIKDKMVKLGLNDFVIPHTDLISIGDRLRNIFP